MYAQEGQKRERGNFGVGARSLGYYLFIVTTNIAKINKQINKVDSYEDFKIWGVRKRRSGTGDFGGRLGYLGNW